MTKNLKKIKDVQPSKLLGKWKKNQLCLFVTHQMGKKFEFSSVSKGRIKLTLSVASGHLTNTDILLTCTHFLSLP